MAGEHAGPRGPVRASRVATELMAEPVQRFDGGVFLLDGTTIVPEKQAAGVAGDCAPPTPAAARGGITTPGSLSAHPTSGSIVCLQLRSNTLAGHEITYVGVIQIA